MTKFNKQATIAREITSHSTITQNKEGGIAFKPTAKTDLTLRLLTYLVGEPKFYDNSTEDQEIRELIASVSQEDPEYLMRLASYARNEMYLRSSPIFLLVESVAYDAIKPFIRNYTPHIVKRADELTETIAYFIQRNGQIGSRGASSIPSSLKKGLADAFHDFDAYQFAKYDRNTTVKLRDVLRLVHPKPRNDEESTLFKQINERTLPIPQTWETIISTQGSTKEAWESIIPKMGYMAKLRNLRNFIKVGVDITPVLSHLTNPKAVKNSKQFPFRFLSAYKIVKELDIDPFIKRQVLVALEEALELSVENIPQWSGRTFITSDNSGSMNSPISGKSKMLCLELANVMGAISQRISDNAVSSVFASQFAMVSLDPHGGILSNTKQMRRAGRQVGGGTNAYLIFNYLLDHNVNVDRILIFSDMQCYGPENRFGIWSRHDQSLASQLKKYKRSINPNVYLYSFDLTGYGTLQFPEDEPRVCLVAGWSNRVFEFIKNYEEFDTNLIKRIETYNPIITD